MLQLIPGSDTSSSTDTFSLDQKIGAWQPSMEHLRTKSFPTPFAQAEMMSHLLGQLSLDPGAPQPSPEAVNDRLQQSFERWRLLLLGLVLGEVVLDTVDLRRPEAGNFGSMVSDLRPECRFLGLLRDRRRAGAEGRRLLVGATDPQCLLWCSPRVARINYWSDLKTRIDASAERTDALRLLADWRQVFARNDLWAPGHEQSPPWMKALQVLLGDATEPANALATDARMVGPVRLAVVPRGASDPSDMVVYLPVREPQWAARFAELLFFQPQRRDGGLVDMVDPNGRPIVSVRIAPGEPEAPGAARQSMMVGASVAGQELLAGVGRLENGAESASAHGQSHWMEDHGQQPGYRSLVLNPLFAASARSHHRASISEADVRSFPLMFPDTVRLVIAPSHGEEDGDRITLSREVTERVRQTVGIAAPRVGQCLEVWRPNQPLPRVVAVPDGDGPVFAGLVESFGPEAKSIDVGEIRALGHALWLYYIGDAELRSDGAKVLWTADSAQELFGRLVVGTSVRSLEVLRDGIAAVQSDTTRNRTRDRLATLQRFQATWNAVGDADDATPASQAARLGRIAATTFVRWVMGNLQLGAFGHRATAPREYFLLTPEARLPLFQDPYARVEG